MINVAPAKHQNIMVVLAQSSNLSELLLKKGCLEKYNTLIFGSSYSAC